MVKNLSFHRGIFWGLDIKTKLSNTRSLLNTRRGHEQTEQRFVIIRYVTR